MLQVTMHTILATVVLCFSAAQASKYNNYIFMPIYLPRICEVCTAKVDNTSSNTKQQSAKCFSIS